MHDTLKLRFLTKVRKTPTCWIWVGGYFNDGYGSIWYKGKNIRVNRASWLIYKGQIPPNMEVCHTCDNIKCANPDHLFLGSRLDNERDKWEKGKVPTGENNGAAVLTNEEVIQIKQLLRRGYTNTLLAKKFNVDPSTISTIKTGKKWLSVEE